MITITAIIRVRKGHEQTMSKTLLEVADHVRKNEAGAVSFFVSQDNEDPCVFTTYERFVDSSATTLTTIQRSSPAFSAFSMAMSS
jgi:quinol monooxygenase YgiN